MATPLYRYVFSDGEYRAVVVDWTWLQKHTYKELVELLNELNEKAPEVKAN